MESEELGFNLNVFAPKESQVNGELPVLVGLLLSVFGFVVETRKRHDCFLFNHLVGFRFGFSKFISFQGVTPRLLAQESTIQQQWWVSGRRQCRFSSL